MLCQNCKINDATIHLYTNLNGKQQQVDLLPQLLPNYEDRP